MSRSIDLSQPLSAEEMEYVNNRPWLKKEAELQGITITAADDEFVVDETSDAGDGGVEDDEEEAESYEDMGVEALREELGRRGLVKSGSKEQLIARLEEDDESDSE